MKRRLGKLSPILKPSLNWFLVFVPGTVVLDFVAPERGTLIFIFACVAIIPLAGWLGRATEHLASRTGEGLGGLLNATFGNAAELIIALMALRQGLIDVVKASLTGSIIGNILLVMGAAFLTGGLKHHKQQFNSSAARIQATALTLAVVALVAPALFHHLGGGKGAAVTLSTEISVVLIVTYGLMLVFSLRTHRRLFDGHGHQEPTDQEHGEPGWSVRRSLTVLAIAAGLIAWVSEILVGSVEAAAHAFGMTEVFIGVIVVAVVGNAAEHSTAIFAAARNRMDLAVGIAVGSSLQIALFVAPLLVFASYVLAPEPMDLVFTPAEVVAVGLAILITEQITGDGETNWLEGVQLLAVYAILAVLFYFLPGA